MKPRHYVCEECGKPRGEERDTRIERCTGCGKLLCAHHGFNYTSGVLRCPGCLAKPRMPEATYAGRLSACVWRTEYGAYRHQTSVRYYRKQDADEMLTAAEALGYVAHLREIPHVSRWRDWYGRPCSVSDPTFELWVEMNQTDVPREVGRRIKSARYDGLAEKLAHLHPDRSKWGYKDHELYHRAMGTL